jgi:hypothetical protein
MRWSLAHVDIWYIIPKFLGISSSLAYQISLIVSYLEWNFMSFALTNKFTVAAVQEKYMKEDENSDLQ